MAQDRDLQADYAELYTASHGRFDVVDVPELRYVVASGRGAVTSPEFQQAAEAVSVVARGVRQIGVERVGVTHAVAPLEVLWSSSVDGGREWTISILQPSWVECDTVDEALHRASVFSPWIEFLPGIRQQFLAEGRSVQTLHVGSVEDADETYRRLVEDVLPGQQLQPVGTRHEIYLTNPRATAPADMRTIVRQPVVSLHVPEPADFVASSPVRC